jgi:hypothetical protein
MKQKNDVENIRQDLENNNDNIQIEYNDDDDFELEKTKSLNKFPLKVINNEFYLDDIYKNFSKSLNFNFNKCFAPKPKIKQSSRNPTPIIYEKQTDISNLKTQDHIITEDAYSEKEISLDNESFSSDFENQNNEINIINNNNKNTVNNDFIYNNKNMNNNNYIISKNLLDNNSDKKSEDKNINLYENKINIIEDDKKNNNLKIYEHKTISVFPVKNNYNDTYVKGNLKAIRNSLYRAKLKCLKENNREVEYFIRDKTKKKYGLDLINNKSKKNTHNFDFCKVIPININKKEEDNNKNDEEIGDMSNFRKTISYNTSKLNLENKKKKEGKGITIYDVLLTNKKNKNEK